MSELERIDNDIKQLELQLENARLKRRIYELEHTAHKDVTKIHSPGIRPRTSDAKISEIQEAWMAGMSGQEITQLCGVSWPTVLKYKPANAPQRSKKQPKSHKKLPSLADEIPEFSVDFAKNGGLIM